MVTDLAKLPKMCTIKQHSIVFVLHPECEQRFLLLHHRLNDSSSHVLTATSLSSTPRIS